MRILVCGGRYFNDIPKLDRKLDQVHAQYGFTDLIHGNASGADQLAHFWGLAHGLRVHVFTADWVKYGRAAGPIRNRRMLDEGRPDVVIAFPGGKGTKNMIGQAMAAGIETIIVS